MQLTRIADDEKLYRSLRSGDWSFPEGALKISATAFNDRDCKPSVDRSSLRLDPMDAKRSATDEVTLLLASEVRGIADVRVTPTKPDDLSCFGVDAIHRPILASSGETENLAHSQIECTPEIQATRFKKIKEALAIIAMKHGLVASPPGPN